jgi:hypothetical protein
VSDTATARLAGAVELALAGDWQGAHAVAQDHEGHPLADWLHAVAHRMEGDLLNARYWYGRCGRAPREHLPPSEELRELQAALAAQR